MVGVKKIDLPVREINMIRTFKKKDLLYLRRVLMTRCISGERREKVQGICRFLSHREYREIAPHEEGKVIINR